MNPALVIVPTYQEAGNLEEFTSRLAGVQPAVDLLIVDDASGDGTPEWVRARPEFEKSLFLLERPGKQGLGTAYVEGFRWALARDYAFILQMDADLSHDPAAIPSLLEATRRHDVVVGSRYTGGTRVLNWPLSRLALSLGAARYVKLLTGLPLADPTGGFKCFRREALERFDLARVRSNGYAFQIEMNHLAWRMGLRIVEVPIVFEGRHAGTSKMSGAIAREAFRQVWRLAGQGLIAGRPEGQADAKPGAAPTPAPPSRPAPCENTPSYRD